MDSKITDLICSVDAFAKAHVKPSRYEHSVRVAQTARKMADLYGYDADKAYLAGIGHDICKDFSDDEMIALAKKDGNPIIGIEAEKPALLHGRAAAVTLKEEFKIDDDEILLAVANHTFGSFEAGRLGMIIFAADKIEPGRPQSTEEYRAGLFSKSLAGLTLAVVEENIDYLNKNGKTVADVSFAFRDKLKEALNLEKN